jgi:hypothetical protein
MLNKTVSCTLNIEKFSINFTISPDSILKIYFDNNYIWCEKIFGANTNFGIESIDVIIRIINCVSKKEEWKNKYPSPLPLVT